MPAGRTTAAYDPTLYDEAGNYIGPPADASAPTPPVDQAAVAPVPVPASTSEATVDPNYTAYTPPPAADPNAATLTPAPTVAPAPAAAPPPPPAPAATAPVPEPSPTSAPVLGSGGQDVSPDASGYGGYDPLSSAYVAPPPAASAPVSPPPVASPPPARTSYVNAPLNTFDSAFTFRPGVPGSGTAALLNAGNYTGTYPAEPPSPTSTLIPRPGEVLGGPPDTSTQEDWNALTAPHYSQVHGQPIPPPPESPRSLGPLAGTLWDPWAPAPGYTTQDLVAARQANLDVNSGPTRGRSEGNVALGMPYLGMWGGAEAPADVGGGGPLIPEPVRTGAGEYRPGFNAQGGVVTKAGAPKTYGPGLRRTPGGGLSAEHPDYVSPSRVGAVVEPPPAPAPNTVTASGRTIGEIQADPFQGRTVFPEAGLNAQDSAFTFRPAPENFTPSEARPISPGEGTVAAPEARAAAAPVIPPKTEGVSARFVQPDGTVITPGEPPGTSRVTKPDGFSYLIDSRGQPIDGTSRTAGGPAAPVAAPVPAPRTVTPTEESIGSILRRNMMNQPDAATIRAIDDAVEAGDNETFQRLTGRSLNDPIPPPYGQQPGPVAAPVVAPVPEPRTVTAAEAVPAGEPAITGPVPEPTTGAGQATEPVATVPAGPAARRPGVVKRIITPTPKKVIGAVGLGVLAAKEAYQGGDKPAGAPVGTTPTTPAPKGDPIPKNTATFGDKKFPGVILRGDPKAGSADGVYDENGTYHAFPADMTDDQYLAQMQSILHNQERVATQQAKAALAGDTAPTDTAATAPVSEPANTTTSAIPLATITGVTDTTTSPSGGGTSPLVSGETGTPTGTDAGTSTTTKGSSSGSSKGYYDANGAWHWYNDYSKSSGSSSSHSSSSRYSSSHASTKKKKGSSLPSGSMWDGFPFNRPPSSIRQLVLDAIAASHAKSKYTKH